MKRSLQVIRELRGELSRVCEKVTTGHQRIKAYIVVRTILRGELLKPGEKVTTGQQRIKAYISRCKNNKGQDE